jgi:adenylate cyclase
MRAPVPLSQGAAPGASTTGVGAPDAQRRATWVRVIAAAITVGLLIGAGVWIVRRALLSSSPERGAGGAAATAKSVAVMPFTDLSPESNQEYFTIGLAEELVNSLAQLPDLRVASYKARPGADVRALDLRSIAEQMHVGTVLQGSVTKAGSRVRIRVQLVEFPAGHNLWSDTYDRTLDDIFAVQDDIARSVAAALQVTLFAEPNSPRPSNPEAYNLVLQAQYLRNVGGRDELQRALQLVERAAAIDPANARVFAELSRVQLARAGDGRAGDAAYGDAWRAATRAVELDPGLADAHQAVGWFSMVKNWDWAAAHQSFEKALALEPRNVRALRSAAALAATLGRFDEAIALGLRAMEIEPANASIYYNLGILQRKAGQLDAALINGRRALELESRMPHAHFQLGAAHLLKGSIEDAMRAFGDEQDESSRPRGLAMGYHTLGRPAESEKHLQQLIAEHRDESAREIAQVYAWRGEKDKAFEWLDRAFAQRDIGLAELKGEPLFRNLQDDPRWTTFLVERLKLPR